MLVSAIVVATAAVAVVVPVAVAAVMAVVAQPLCRGASIVKTGAPRLLRLRLPWSDSLAQDIGAVATVHVM